MASYKVCSEKDKGDMHGINKRTLSGFYIAGQTSQTSQVQGRSQVWAWGASALPN